LPWLQNIRPDHSSKGEALPVFGWSLYLVNCSIFFERLIVELATATTTDTASTTITTFVLLYLQIYSISATKRLRSFAYFNEKSHTT
jgi:hypothetical protein